MQVLLLKTKKDKKTDNNTIYKSKKINESAYIHHDSRLVKIIKNACPFIKEKLLCALKIHFLQKKIRSASCIIVMNMEVA